MGKTRLLFDNSTTDVRPARQLVFGELVKLAFPVIEAYHSDLFHDALWLENFLAGREMTFYWSVDESGTTIGTDRVGLRTNAYEVTVANDAGVTRMEAKVI